MTTIDFRGNWLAARNESCLLMDCGYTRIGCKEGFVMVKGNAVIVLKVLGDITVEQPLCRQ